MLVADVAVDGTQYTVVYRYKGAHSNWWKWAFKSANDRTRHVRALERLLLYVGYGEEPAKDVIPSHHGRPVALEGDFNSYEFWEYGADGLPHCRQPPNVL